MSPFSRIRLVFTAPLMSGILLRPGLRFLGVGVEFAEGIHRGSVVGNIQTGFVLQSWSSLISECSAIGCVDWFSTFAGVSVLSVSCVLPLYFLVIFANSFYEW